MKSNFETSMREIWLRTLHSRRTVIILHAFCVSIWSVHSIEAFYCLESRSSHLHL